ncbi:MAG: glycosyltransferase family 39 protein [Candidatus Omnitrophica bacterium]|nr:glycosyltransferase family 39 protein [Candidatus Omnitrophota bacterium]
MTKNTENTNPIRYSQLLWIATLLGAILRLYKLGSHNLWFDELATIFYTKLPISKFGNSFAHHLYYIVLKCWVFLFGTSELSLRFPSMIFGILSILLIYHLGRIIFNRRVGIISAFILAISPMCVWYSQEARGYSLSVLLTMLVVYFFYVILKSHKLSYIKGFIVVSILAINNNYISLYSIITASVFLILYGRARLDRLKRIKISRKALHAQRVNLLPEEARPGFLRFKRSFMGKMKLKKLKNTKHRKIWLILRILIILIFAIPQLYFLSLNIIKVADNFWIPKPAFSSILTTFYNFNTGYNSTAMIHSVMFVTFSLLLVYGIWAWRKTRRVELIQLSLFLFVPIIITFLISQKIPIYIDRQLMFFSPFYYILLSAGLAKINKRTIRAGIYIIIVFSSLFCLNNYFSNYMPLSLRYHVGVHVKQPVKPAADYVNNQLINGDAVSFSDQSTLSVLYYMPKILDEKNKITVIIFIIQSKLEEYWKKLGMGVGYGRYTWVYSSSRKLVVLDQRNAFKKIKKSNFKRIWLISSSWEKDGSLTLHSEAVRKWLRGRYQLLDTKVFNGIFIDLYAGEIK